jgi:hypothetical protein
MLLCLMKKYIVVLVGRMTPQSWLTSFTSWEDFHQLLELLMAATSKFHLQMKTSWPT